MDTAEMYTLIFNSNDTAVGSASDRCRDDYNCAILNTNSRATNSNQAIFDMHRPNLAIVFRFDRSIYTYHLNIE